MIHLPSGVVVNEDDYYILRDRSGFRYASTRIAVEDERHRQMIIDSWYDSVVIPEWM